MEFSREEKEKLIWSLGGILGVGSQLVTIPTLTLSTCIPITLGGVAVGGIYGIYRIATRSEREYRKMIEEQREKWNEYWKGVGIKNKQDEYPTLVNIFQNKHGKIYSFINPIGLSSKDYDNKDISIREFIGSRKVSFEMNGDFINIETLEAELPTMIPYVNKKVKDKSKLEISIGETIYGNYSIPFDESNGHLLVSGSSGGGKSCSTRVILTSLIQNYSEKDVELWLGDFKRVELMPFQHAKITKRFATEKEDIYQLVLDLQKEMKERYDLFTEYRANDIRTFNKKVPRKLKMKRIVFFIEEVAEFYQNENMKKDKESQAYIKEVYEAMLQLSQQARACGIHLMMTLQRPSANDFPPSIKANIPTRYCLATSDSVNSEIILGKGDGSASELRGNGHAILKNNEGKYEIQTYYIPFEELDNQLYDYLTDEGKRLVDKDRRRSFSR